VRTIRKTQDGKKTRQTKNQGKLRLDTEKHRRKREKANHGEKSLMKKKVTTLLPLGQKESKTQRRRESRLKKKQKKQKGMCKRHQIEKNRRQKSKVAHLLLNKASVPIINDEVAPRKFWLEKGKRGGKPDQARLADRQAWTERGNSQNSLS